MMGPWFFAVNALVFSSVTSASSWETFRQAISALVLLYFCQKGLIEKHGLLFDLATWDDKPSHDIEFVQATVYYKYQ